MAKAVECHVIHTAWGGNLRIVLGLFKTKAKAEKFARVINAELCWCVGKSKSEWIDCPCFTDSHDALTINLFDYLNKEG